MIKYIQLSYPISTDMPLYPGSPKTEVRQIKDISKNDSCNTFFISLYNHAGTHIDAPAHFVKGGKRISDYTVEYLIFNKPIVLDCPKNKNEAITIKDISDKLLNVSCDIILIRTGFGKLRKVEKSSYETQNPFLLPETAEWIRKNKPEVRAVGIDCISIANSFRKNEGKAAHQALLADDASSSQPVLIIEDMNLQFDVDEYKQIIVSPLVVESFDSSPCTVIGTTNI